MDYLNEHTPMNLFSALESSSPFSQEESSESGNCNYLWVVLAVLLVLLLLGSCAYKAQPYVRSYYQRKINRR